MKSCLTKESVSDYINRNHNRNTIMALAHKSDAVLMSSFMKAPELTKGLPNFEVILGILLEKGHKRNIEDLAKSNKVDKYAKEKIRAVLNKDQADHINRTLFLS